MAPHCSTCCCQSTQISLDTPELPDDVNAYIISNEPPSASDLAMLRDYRLSLDSYLTRLDTEIITLSAMQEQLEKELNLRKAALNALRTERRVLEERQQSIPHALSPLRRLPLEVLQEIFLCTLARSSEPDYTWFDVFDPQESPWTVRRVCRNWRAAATQFPHLWTGLLISRTGLGNLSVLRDVLHRSRSLLLRIDFFWDEHRPAIHLGSILLDELVKHSERWQSASFYGVGRTFTRPISALRGRLPRLEELDLSHCNLTLSDYMEDAHPFEIAPSLKKATLHLAVVKLDYSRLESFTSRASAPAAFEVLVSSPHLIYLADYHRGAIANEDSSQNKPRYLHSRLKTFHVRECSQLNMFTLPNLEHLHAGPPYVSALSPSLPIISQFLLVSRCSLLSLTIHNCELSIGSLPELLRLVPRLQILSININSFLMERGTVTPTDEALNLLINRLAERPSDELSLVPKLRAFVFKSCLEDPWRFMDTSIVDMICVRSGMEMVSFIVHPKSLLPNLSDNDIARLSTIKADGFNVSILKQKSEYQETIVLI